MLGPVRPTKPSGRPPRRSLESPWDKPCGGASRGNSSIMLFHAPQPSHRPVHLAWTEPHCWQTKRACDRGIRSTAVSVVLGCPIGAGPEPVNAVLAHIFEGGVLGDRARGLH